MLRLDLFLVQNGFVSSRERAKKAIQKGVVLVNGRVTQKASLVLDEHDRVEVKIPEDEKDEEDVVRDILRRALVDYPNVRII